MTPERENLQTATFEAPKPMLRVVTEVLDELIENGDSYVSRDVPKWNKRLHEISDRLLDPSCDVQDTLVLVATTALTAALQLEEAAT